MRLPSGCCPVPPVQEVALLLPMPLAPATVAETLGSSNSQKGVQPNTCASWEGIQGRPRGVDWREEGGSNKNKACFRRYSLAALSCYGENTVLSPLEKRPQLSPVRQCEGCSAQLWIRRNLFPKKQSSREFYCFQKPPILK